MVCYAEMGETKEASIIIPIDRKVERGNESEQPYQRIDDTKDAVVRDRQSSKSCRNPKRPVIREMTFPKVSESKLPKTALTPVLFSSGVKKPTGPKMVKTTPIMRATVRLGVQVALIACIKIISPLYQKRLFYQSRYNTCSGIY